MEKNSKIFVAGHRGLVGSAIVRNLQKRGYTNLVLRSSHELDLRRQEKVEAFFEKERPEYVFLAAAKVGGILANSTVPAEFIYDNLMIETNIINSAHLFGTRKLLFLGSSCIYPKFAPQPIKEEYLLMDYLEPTNEAYAIAKISGVEMCKFYRKQYGCDFISAMPTNLYGPFDNYNLNSSHVLPALIRKFHEGKIARSSSVVIWGSGTPLREFLYVDDLADACLFLMDKYSQDVHINVGTGKEISIQNLAEMISEVVGYDGAIEHDPSKPDGTPRKLLDISRLRDLGWVSSTPLKEGIRKSYEWFVTNDKKSS